MDAFTCNLCQLNCGNAYNYQSHLVGQLHAKRRVNVPHSFICTVCNVDCMSNEANFVAHLLGKQHIKKAAQLTSTLPTTTVLSVILPPFILTPTTLPPSPLKRDASSDEDYESSPKRKHNTTYDIRIVDKSIIEESVLETELNSSIFNFPLVDYSDSDDEEEEMAIHNSPDSFDAALDAEDDDDVIITPDNTSDDDCKDGYESGEIHASEESIIVDIPISTTVIEEIPITATAIVDITTAIEAIEDYPIEAFQSPAKPPPKLRVTGFLEKLAPINPSLFYNSPKKPQQFTTPERRYLQQKNCKGKFIQRCINNNGIMDGEGILQVIPKYKPEIRYTWLIPQYMRTMIYFQGIQAKFHDDIKKALPLPS